MAEVIWGLATSHVPSIGAAMDRQKTEDPNWKDLFDGYAWPCPVVPVLVNVIQYPQPTAARCYALGQALGRALRSYRDDVTVGILGTGGMSHQLAGARAGFINPEFDRMWMETIETDPARLATLSREELIRQAGSEGIELIMWLVMRGAMSERITKVHSHYFVPASNTAAGLALF